MIEKISLANVVEFKRRSDKSRVTLINNLNKKKKETISDDGGDYWVIARSAIGNAFKNNNNDLILDKIDEVVEKRNNATATISRNMYQRNISILNSFDKFDFTDFKPDTKLDYLPKSQSIISIKGVPVQIRPSYVFSYKEKNINKIGAIWFVGKWEKFDMGEVALFTDSLYRYLKFNYRKFEIEPRYCVTLDFVTKQSINYMQIQNEKIHSFRFVFACN
jgi:hypothetical protein